MQTHHPHPEQALPAEVSIQSDTWLNRYRNYPVFSRTWFRYRVTAFFYTFVAMLLIAALMVFAKNGDWRIFAVVSVTITVGALGLVSFGQLLAMWVRQKAFKAKKEGILLVLAIVVGGGMSYGASSGAEMLMNGLIFGDPHHEVFGGEKKPQITRTVTTTVHAGQASQTASDSAPDPAPPVDSKKNQKNSAWVDALFKGVAMFPFVFMVSYMGSVFDLWYFFRQRKRLIEVQRQQELQRAQDARREAELRLSVLVAQVEPHFLFNTLAGVRSAILTEPLRATAIVDHLVDYLRSTIPQMRGDGSSEQGRLAKQLEAARAYLGLMQARIPRLTFSVESELKDAAFPPLLLITLVENAIKHGIEPKIGAAHVSVTARYFDEGDEEKLEVKVEDDGVGFGGATSGSGIGLANVRDRLESMYGDRASLVLKARAEGGVAAIISLPLIP
ncbi:MAG: histidine kinase [Burkholderiales bacterium]|nr:histidine kinase [Burkholderiales bacterium]